MRVFMISVLGLFFSINSVAAAAKDGIFEIEVGGRYQMESPSQIELAKKVALFDAQRKAIELAGRYLSHQSLIEVYELDKDEIYSLAASKIQSKIVDEKLEPSGNATIYRLRIRARIQSSDFIKAAIEDAKLEKKEAKASYREEMEQPVSALIDPGRDIAKAYRLLREKKWRIALIYLNHLEKKYPNWDSIFMAKAIVHYIFNEPEAMEKALDKACRLGNQMACEEVKDLKQVHEHNFGFSLPLGQDLK
jgi:hypothetical protein